VRAAAHNAVALIGKRVANPSLVALVSPPRERGLRTSRAAVPVRAAELSQVRRFSDPWEVRASLRLRKGDVSVLEEYDARGRIAGGDREEMVEEAFSVWLVARRAGESVVVVAPDHAMVDALALWARAVRG